MQSGTLETVVRFTGLVTAASDPDDVLRLLARTTVDHLGASAAAVLTVRGRGITRVAASAGSLDLDGFSLGTYDLGSDLGERLMEASGACFEESRTIPLVSSGDLYGALVLFFARAVPLEADVSLARAIVDLTAIALERAREYRKLSQTYSELKAAHDTLTRTEKLRALGEMAAGISHDLKNILSPLGLHAHLLKRSADQPHRVRRVAEALELVYKRSTDTVERLRGFSRQSPEGCETEIVDLSVLAEEAVELCRHRISRERVAFRVEDGHAPPVMVPTSELVAAIVNTIVNALDALPEEGGTITVRTGPSSRGAFVQVQDTGKGMPDEVRQRIFEPFFTTKGKKGTGLGLSIVYAFVQRHGGKIDVESAPGLGTTITMAFPAALPENAHALSSMP